MENVKNFFTIKGIYIYIYIYIYALVEFIINDNIINPSRKEEQNYI